ncbi:MAG: type II toxin-antitoxin system RelE/ParE family toxin [Epsilonproteobacteria bacterium]|nr:type II toxin-antitoxin system RelE/ParE family toxin [Campylobacterota bacterium]
MYRVKYHKQVVKFLQKQDKNVVLKIINFFDEIKIDLDFSNYDVKQLKGFKNKYRLKISKYRIIFNIENDELLIEVIKAGSRGDIYK